MQLIQAQGFGQCLLSKSLFGQDRRDAVRTLLALRWVQQNKLLNLAQLVDEVFHRDSVPGPLRLFVEILQERDAEPAIKEHGYESCDRSSDCPSRKYNRRVYDGIRRRGSE